MIFLAVIISYLLGSIPFAYVIAKIYKGIDIRQHGSGNVGATNVFRVLGKGPGIIVFLLDTLKGIAAVYIPEFFGSFSVTSRIVMAIAVVVGHNWTIFLKFKGGKGVAASLGVLIGLTIKVTSIRPVLFITILIWVATFFITSIVSISSILAATALPIIMVLTNQPLELNILGIIFCLFVVFRHRPNIKRLLSGQEPKATLPFFNKKP